MQNPSSLPPKPFAEKYQPELTRLPEYTLGRRIARWGLILLSRLLVFLRTRLAVRGLHNFPERGPGLIVLNHLGDSDIAIILSQLPTRNVDILGASNLHDDLPWVGTLGDLYGVIWLHRGRADIRALRAALDGFAEGRVIVIAPEGRYSVTGALEEGSGGAAFLAYKSGASILPIAITGTENENVHGSLKKFRRAAVHVSVGKMFKLSGQAESRQEAVSQGTNQIMQALADLLPEKYRGAYSSK